MSRENSLEALNSHFNRRIIFRAKRFYGVFYDSLSLEEYLHIVRLSLLLLSYIDSFCNLFTHPKYPMAAAMIMVMVRTTPTNIAQMTATLAVEETESSAPRPLRAELLRHTAAQT